MRIEKGELPQANLRFNSKTQVNHLFDTWYQKVLAFPGVSKKLNQAGVKKAITRARLVC